MNDEIIDELAIVGFGSHSVKSYFNMPSIIFFLYIFFIVEQNAQVEELLDILRKGKKRPHLLNELPWTLESNEMHVKKVIKNIYHSSSSTHSLLLCMRVDKQKKLEGKRK